MLLTIPYPAWLSPEIFTIPGLGLAVRWYSLGYIIAFTIAFLLYRVQIRERRFPMSEDDLNSLFLCGILSLILGARLFSAMVYDQSNEFWLRPWLAFWPFRNGVFTGFLGMSYHGGVIGGVLAIIIWSAVKRYDYRETGDMFAASIPLGYTFGRLGNFANAELYGRVTTGPWGMIFPGAAEFPASEAWVQDVAAQTGTAIVGATVNLPRHPSQLYEAFLEGILLWLIIWFFRNRKPFKGFLSGLYIAGYGVFRFLVEYVREPDAHIGFVFEFGERGLPTALAHPLLSFSTGQVLSSGMIAIGLLWILIASKLPNNKSVLVYLDSNRPKAPTEAEKKTAQKSRRKLRKKLR